jgi:hypothetical protein
MIYFKVFMTHWSHTAKGDISNDLIPAENDGHKGMK